MREHPKSANIVYLLLVGVVFVALTVVFLFFPRSQFSELEKRDLAEFPDINSPKYRGNLSQLTADISQWFSDSEPYRDRFMTWSMKIRNSMGISHPGPPEEQISFKPATQGDSDVEGMEEFVIDEPLEPTGNPMADANAKISNSGTIVVGSGSNVRALMAFGGSPQAGNKFAKAANEYGETFPGLNVYALVAPLATEFYLPSKGASLSKPQKPVIDNIESSLSPRVKFVDAYKYLAAHTNEDIYLRTDHHWAPLGAYYAAKAFAARAGVPFPDLENYERHVIRNFVGTMFGYTKDIAVKNAPEDFVYYTPTGLNYKSVFTTFNTDKNYQVTSVSKPFEDSFFRKFKDGSSNAYLTFMGSDQNLVKVTTGTNSPRKLLIIKDSYGNALPGYLFYSFGEVHVIDFRYFPYSVKDYVANNGITDILLAFNIFNACSNYAMNRITGFLTKASGVNASSESSEKAKETVHAPEEHAPEVKTPPAGTPEPERETEKNEEQPQAAPVEEIQSDD